MIDARHGQESDVHRYGFNGMESDDEIKGEGNSVNYKFRMHDPRIGSWLSLDPLMSNFSCQSPYVGYDNNPIYFNDPKGLESEVAGDDEKMKKKSEADCADCEDQKLKDGQGNVEKQQFIAPLEGTLLIKQ